MFWQLVVTHDDFHFVRHHTSWVPVIFLTRLHLLLEPQVVNSTHSLGALARFQVTKYIGLLWLSGWLLLLGLSRVLLGLRQLLL
jgi:hypothetical protein